MINDYKFDVFIIAGQSNAEGYGLGPVTEEYIPQDNIFCLNVNINVTDTGSGLDIVYPDTPFIIEMATERSNSDGKPLGDLSLSFSKEYVSHKCLEDGRKLLIIRAAVGGTGFKKKHWGENDSVYHKMLQMTDYALSLNKENRLKAMLWHQGEHDAFEGNTPSSYHSQLKTLFLNVRKRYSCSNLPIIAGDFCHHFKISNPNNCEEIVKEIKSVIYEIGNSAFVETDGLLSNDQTIKNGDTYHFSRESLILLGKRYFMAYTKGE